MIKEVVLFFEKHVGEANSTVSVYYRINKVIIKTKRQPPWLDEEDVRFKKVDFSFYNVLPCSSLHPLGICKFKRGNKLVAVFTI